MRGVIMIAVAVIVVAAFIPVISDSAASIKSIEKNDTTGTFTYSVEASPTVNISVGDSVINVNEYSLNPTMQTLLAACDEWAIFTFNNSRFYVLYAGEFDEVKAGTTATIANGELNYTKSTNVDVTKPVVGDVLYASAVNPTYLVYLDSATVKVNEGAIIYFEQNRQYTNAELNPSSLSAITYGKGTTSNLAVICTNEAITDSTATLSAEPAKHAGHLDMANAFNVSITNSTGTYSIENGVYGVYIPIEYYEITQQDNQMQTLIELIPLLLVVSIVVGVIAIVVKSRA